MVLGKEIRKEVRNKEKFFNEFLEGVGKVYLEYSYKMNNTNREPDDRFRILLYPENAPGKLVFYSDGLSMSISYERMAEQLKRYCIALAEAKESEKEYRKVWRKTVGMYYAGLNLIKVDLSKTLDKAQNQIGNNILAILDEKEVSIREMSIALKKDYAGMHRLVNRESLDTTQFKTILEIADYLKVEIQDLYKTKGGNKMLDIDAIENVLEIQNLGIDFESFNTGDELADWLDGRKFPGFDEPMEVTEDQRETLREIYEQN